MINTDSPSYQYGLKNNFYLNNGTTIKWWHGHGSFIDYTSPYAMDWWHKQMDLVLDIGIDGWKCDGTDPFVFLLFGAYGWGGSISERDYANDYYRDFFYYTRKKNPDSLIMSRPVDSYPPVYWDFSPRDVVFSGWVGDQDPTFSGLQDALRNCFESAWAGYLNFGSDIGGYRSGQKRTRTVFLRWAQWGAFMPLMENGGGGPHFPWQFEPVAETVAIYRSFVNFHYELKSYLLSAGSTAYPQGISVITPLADEVIIPYIHSWDYMLWTDLFIAPIVEDSLERKIEFPDKNDWVYWFDSSKVYKGGSEQKFNIPMNQYPVYHRKGSIIPLNVNSHDSLHGDENSIGKITALVHPIKTVGFAPIRRWNKSSIELSYDWTAETFIFTSTQSDEPVILLIQSVVGCPTRGQDMLLEKELTIQSHKLASEETGIYCNLETNQVFVYTGESNKGVYVQLEGLRVL